MLVSSFEIRQQLPHSRRYRRHRGQCIQYRVSNREMWEMQRKKMKQNSNPNKNTKFNGLFILICRQQHFGTFLFKWNGRLRTFMSKCSQYEVKCSITFFLFVEKKQQLLIRWNIWIDFFESHQEMKIETKKKRTKKW